MKLFYIVNMFLVVSSFFTPSIKTSKGEKLTVSGNGPPILFSPGLYGTMPSQFYNNFLNKLKKNNTVITYNNFNKLNSESINDVTEAIGVDKISYVSHSSFEPNILNNEKINNAVLLDPISIPNVNFNGIERHQINPKFPILIIKADKLYNTDIPLPEWQEIEFLNNELITEEYYENVGHPDILDDTWSNFAMNLNLWDTTKGEIVEFNNWKLNHKNSITNTRKLYREYVAKKIIDFINE